MMLLKITALFLLFQASLCSIRTQQRPNILILRQNVDRLEYLSRNQHSTGFQLKKWHDLFAADSPRIWDHHTSKLSTMCFKTRHMNRQLGSTKDTHVSEVLRCCESEETERMDCFQRMQEKYMDMCCMDDEIDVQQHPCCSRQSEHRFRCFRQNPQIMMACFKSYRFNSSMHSYRTYNNQRQADVNDESSSSEAEPNTDAEPDSSSSSSESSESAEENQPENELNWEEEDDMLIREISENIPLETEPECLEMRSEDFLRHDLPEEMNTTEEICSADKPRPPKPSPKPGKCSKCCKIGAYVGEHYVKRRGCPYIQCRHFFSAFQKVHKKCIKHPKICGHFFVSCCVRHHHRQVDREMENTAEMKEIDILAQPISRNRNIKRRRQTLREE